jgi:hypothetical protein
MSFVPALRSHGRPARRGHLSVHPGLLAAAGILIIFAVVLVSAIVNGIPQLDPQAQMFVVP